MRRLLIAFLFFAGLGWSLQAAETSTAKNDFLVVYGKMNRRAGPINSRTTRANLAALFGKTKLRNSTIVLGENGVKQPSTDILTKGAEATVVWETEARRKIVGILMSKRNSQWHTEDGIKVGTSVQELEKINGAPFKFSGLDWDDGGQIQAATGKLSALDGLSLTLQGNSDAPGAEKFIGDQVNPMSNASGIEKAGIYVGSMTLYFETN